GASSGSQRKSLSIPPVAHSILGSRTTLWSPSRKSALSVPIDGTRSTGSAAHSGNCSSSRRRTSGISIGSSAACIRMPGACPSDRERQRVHRKLGQEDLQRRLELLDDLLVHQQPLVVELRRSVADYDLCLDDPCARGGEHLAELRLRPHGAEGARARADDQRRLAAKDARRDRAREPVHSVLQLPGDRRVVLGRREQEQVRGGDGVAQCGDRLRARLVVLVERRQGLEPVPRLEVDERRQKLLRRAEELRVVRVPAQAARAPENLHRPYASRTKYSSATSLTSFCSAGCPVGSGMFQFRPNSVRSTVVSSCTFTRSLPKPSVIGPAIVPTSSTGFVIPRIVISPWTFSSSPELSTESDANVSSGYRSTSKNSGDCR